ncbi:hypothetical protein [Hirschia maritima]|uniref:hypothetical protein n=1 Tax=Hirschia maritima TaxID=1121961 RepID=UPI0003706A0A|nr:hypothetical protein [Hirschia maritima]
MDLISFFQHPFFNIVGAISSIVLLLGTLVNVFLWFSGVSPVLLRLGLGLSKRKIAVFSAGDSLHMLKDCIVRTGLFKEKNISEVRPLDSDTAKKCSVFLVDYAEFGHSIDEIFSMRKNDQTPILIYAEPGAIPREEMSKVANKPLTNITNTRGRLVNDLILAVIATRND